MSTINLEAMSASKLSLQPPLPTILLAEDEQNDAFFANRAFALAGPPGRLIVVADGQEALDYFDGIGVYGNRTAYPLPALLVLDLKLPKIDGFGVLAWLHGRPQFATLPIVVLTGSLRQSDAETAMQLGAHDYLVKPSAAERLPPMIRYICTRFLQTNWTSAAR